MQCRSANFNKSTLEDIDKQYFLLLDIQHGKEMSRNQKHLIKKKRNQKQTTPEQPCQTECRHATFRSYSKATGKLYARCSQI